MKRLEVLAMLGEVKEAKRKWADAQTTFTADVATIMRRLLHEAAHCYMSAEEVARASGFTVKRVRQMMRDAGLNPRDGKNLLNQKAAEALANNAELLGIEPYEMDLMSPLAYLPMGEQMKRSLQDKKVSQVDADEFLETAEASAINALRMARSEAADYCNLISNHGTDCTCFTVIKQIDNRIAAMERER